MSENKRTWNSIKVIAVQWKPKEEPIEFKLLFFFMCRCYDWHRIPTAVTNCELYSFCCYSALFQVQIPQELMMMARKVVVENLWTTLIFLLFKIVFSSPANCTRARTFREKNILWHRINYLNRRISRTHLYQASKTCSTQQHVESSIATARYSQSDIELNSTTSRDHISITSHIFDEFTELRSWLLDMWIHS